MTSVKVDTEDKNSLVLKNKKTHNNLRMYTDLFRVCNNDS